MAAVTKIRLPDGRDYIPGDWTTAEPLYSTVEVATGALTTLTAFAYGMGGDVPGSNGPRKSTILDTNLEGEGAQLPDSEELVIYSIMAEVYMNGTYGTADTTPPPDAPNVALLDMLRMQSDLLMIFRIASVKEYQRVPMGWNAASTGVQQTNSGARGSGASDGFGFVVGNNGSTDVNGKRLLASPLYVAGGETLALEFRAPTGQVGTTSTPAAFGALNISSTSRMVIRTYLDGFRKRPVA